MGKTHYGSSVLGRQRVGEENCREKAMKGYAMKKSVYQIIPDTGGDRFKSC
jgi:hypothetical protein